MSDLSSGPIRYRQLTAIIKATKPRSIVEVGCWDGQRAIQMATEALKHHPVVAYWGYDLFEDATEETDARELNVKRHVTLDEINATLTKFRDSNPGFSFLLLKGDTRQTLTNDQTEMAYRFDDGTAVGPREAEFVFIDGGHSVETMRSDMEALAGCPVVVMDDFYLEDEDGKRPDITKFGCNSLIDGVKAWKQLADKDSVKDGGHVRMVVRGWEPRVNLVVKTKNCVPEDEIRENIRYSLSRGLPEVAECVPHGNMAIMCSGGPSLIGRLDDIRAYAAKADARIVCVKHSHDTLLGQGIVPWACVLLDPRSHVRDFIEKPHPKVTYLAASMVHRTTIDQLIEKGARVFLYHASVGANEKDIIKKGHMIQGGSTSATRGVPVLYALGFRKFACYGYDSCYYTKPDMKEKTPNGEPRYFEVEVLGRKFWTDGELVAQCQDFEQIIRQGFLVDLETYGDGMIPHIHRQLNGKKASFAETFDAR